MSWQLHDWNEALLSFFFSAEESEAPVRRLSLTTDEFAQIAGVPSELAAAVRNQFLTVLRCRLQAPHRRSVMNDAKRISIGWNADQASVPPFLAHLFVTCMVATDIGEDDSGENRFRERLSAVVGEHSAHHGLTDQTLSHLWHSFSDWLQARRDAGSQLRVLELPSVNEIGHLRIIGISVLLAFPSLRDRRELMHVVSTSSIDPVSPDVHRVIDTIGKNARRFSRRFLDAFDDFRSRVRTGTSRLDRLPFWLAVRDCLVARQIAVGAEHGSSVVLAEPNDDDELTVFVAVNPTAARRLNCSLSPLDEAVRGYTQIAASYANVLERLADAVEAVAPSFVRRVREGVVAFQRDEDGLRTFTANLADDGPSDILIRSDAWQVLSAHLRGHPLLKSYYSGWHELRSANASAIRLAANIAGLQTASLGDTIADTSLRFVNGIRVHGGWYGRSPFLPAVAVQTATSVALSINSREIALSRASDGTWRFPAVDIDSQVTVQAAFVNGESTTRRPVFFADVFLKNFCRPNAGCVLAERATFDLTEYVPLTEVLTQTQQTAIDATHTTEDEIPAELLSTNDNIISALAASSSSAGISESRVLDMLARVDGDKRLQWAKLRSLTEMGVLDRVFDRHWRAAKYFAVSPHVVVTNSTHGASGVVMGLVVPALRAQIFERAKAGSLQTELRSDHRGGVAVLVRAQSSADIFRLARDLELSVGWLRSLDELIPRMPGPTASVPTTNFDAFKSWSWSERRFVPANTQPYDDVAVFWYRRRDAADAPDVFSVQVGQEILYSTRSRRWALLAGYFTRGEFPFHLTSTGLQASAAAVALPLTTSWLSVVIGCCLPAYDDLGVLTYDFGSTSLRDTVRWRLFPEPVEPSGIRWIEAVLSNRTCGDTRIPVPSSLVERASLPSKLRRIIAREGVPRRYLPFALSLFRKGQTN